MIRGYNDWLNFPLTTDQLFYNDWSTSYNDWSNFITTGQVGSEGRNPRNLTVRE